MKKRIKVYLSDDRLGWIYVVWIAGRVVAAGRKPTHEAAQRAALSV